MRKNTLLNSIMLTVLFFLIFVPAGPTDVPQQKKLRNAVASPRNVSGTGMHLLSADFDEDGLQDLVAISKNGNSGTVTIYQGNSTTIYPNSPKAKEQKRSGIHVDAPFLSELASVTLAAVPDFTGVGDFNADGHFDLVVAARNSSTLCWIPGKGKEGFGAVEAKELSGRVTALRTGDINRRDDLADVIVGVTSKDGSAILIFDGSNGFSDPPEMIPLQSDASEIQTGDIDQDPWMDLVVSAGNEIWIIHGEDKTSVASKPKQPEVRGPTVDRIAMPQTIRSFAIDNFSGDSRKDIGIVLSDGNFQVMSRETGWKPHPAIPNAKQMGTEQQRTVLPMRLNSDGIPDVVILSGTALQFEPSAPVNTFVVNDAGDSSDSNPGDSICDTGSGSCTLRAAIEEANASPGEDEITFNVGFGPITITPNSPYNQITEILTIDGTTQPGFSGTPIVEIDGSVVGGGGDGLYVSADGSVIRGLVINEFANGIHIDAPSGGVIVEGNYLGTDLSGENDQGNSGQGVYIQNSPNNVIGGTTPDARNILSGNGGDGVYIEGNSATGNQVIGNYLGVNASGNTSIQNDYAGVEIFAPGNTIGGATAGAGNVSSGNGQHGIAIAQNATGNLVQANLLGTDASGFNSVPNGNSGLWITADNNTAGGASSLSRNIISGNANLGIQLCGGICGGSANGNVVQGNYIGLAFDGNSSLPNASDGIRMAEASFNLVGGTAASERNIIAGNNGWGLYLDNSHSNTIQGNYVGTNTGGKGSRPNNFGGIFVSNGSSGNLIGGDASGARNLISGHNGLYGLLISGNSTSGNAVEGNYFGLTASGLASLPNSSNIAIDNSNNNVIGGDSPEKGNFLAKGNPSIIIGASNGNQVLNNVIGLDGTQTKVLQPGIGIRVSGGSQNNQIGAAGMGNRIIASTSGIDVINSDTSGNSIQGNWIGWPTGSIPSGTGVRIYDSAHDNIIGGNEDGQGNRIENNGGVGILIKDDDTDRNAIRGNSIFNNGGVGIDLRGSTGVSPNDTGDPDFRANEGMNFPVILSVTTDGENTFVNGTLDTPCPDCAQIDLFANSVADPTGYGEGEAFLGSTVPNPDGTFGATLDAVAPGSIITATATDGSGNTSEFSGTYVATFITTLSIADASIGEGNSGTTNLNFTVTLSTPVAFDVYVDYYTQDDTAIEGEDYNNTSGTLMIPAGNTSGTISVPIKGDPDGEPDEKFLVFLTNPNGVEIQDDQGIGTIVNDDGVPAWSISDVAVEEGDSTTNLHFKVHLSQPIGTDVSVSFTTADGTATAPADYTSASGILMIPANATEGTIAVPINGDQLTEADETFYVNLSNPSGGTVVSDPQGMGVILDTPDLVAVPKSETEVQLTWNDPNEEENAFRIDRSDDGTNFYAVATVGANITSYTDSNLCGACSYSYRVVPLISGGPASPSNVAAVTTFPWETTKICLSQISDAHAWARFPSVAYNSNTGKYGMVYMDRNSGNADEIYFQLLNSDGTPDGSPVQLTTNDMPEVFPTIAFNGTNFGVVYGTHMRLPGSQVSPGPTFFALLDGNGTPIRKNVRLNNGLSTGFLNNNLRTALAWDGSGWGLFESPDIDPPSEVTYMRIDEDGDILIPPINISNTPGEGDYNVDAVWNGSEYGVVWTHQFNNGFQELWFQRMQMNGTLIGSPSVVTGVFDSIQSTSLVWDGSGWAVSWDLFTGGNWLINLQQVDSSGNLIGANHQISDDVNPTVGFLDDELPQLMNKPGGGYLIYTTSFECDENFIHCSVYEIGRLEADSNGDRVGSRTIISTNDDRNSGYQSAATDGSGNFLIAYNDNASDTQEVASVVVDTTGAVISNGGPHNDLTTGHGPGNNIWFDSPTNPEVVAYQSGFVTLWNDITAGANHQIFARVYDGDGNITSTRFPLSSRTIRRYPTAVFARGQFAVAWKDNSNNVILERFDGNADSLGETVVATGANGRPDVGLDFNGQEFGLTWAQNGNNQVVFQRVSFDGSVIGTQITVAEVTNGSIAHRPIVKWIGSGWAIIWGQDNNLFFARLDSSGASIVSPAQFSFNGFNGSNFRAAWNGQKLGIVWQSGNVFFTALDANGLKFFNEINLTPQGGDTPSIYWNESESLFKVVFRSSNNPLGIYETEVSDTGAAGSTLLIAHREGVAAVAFDGKTAGVLWSRYNSEMLFETTECLNDQSGPACPGISTSYDGTKATVDWSFVGDDESGIAKYFVFRDGIPLAEMNSGSSSFDDFGVHNGTNIYEVRAMNNAYLLSTGCSTSVIIVGAPDAPVVSVNDINVNEVDGSADFTISLNAPFNVDIDVDYSTADGSAQQGSDYDFTSGTCTIPSGQVTCLVSVPVQNDGTFEPDENFYLYLTNISSGTIGDGEGIATLQSDDGAPGFTINDVAIAETDSMATMYFTVSLSQPLDTDASVDYATVNGTATSPQDYVSATGTATIPAGQTSATFGVTISGDNILEGDENFVVNLSNPTGGADIFDAQGSGIILEAIDLVVAATSETTTHLTWNDPNEDEIGFRIDRSNDGTNFSAAGTVGPDTALFDDSNLCGNCTFFYRVVPLQGVTTAPPCPIEFRISCP